MRRLLAVIPAALMVLMAALPAQANVPPDSKTISPCYLDLSTGIVADSGTFTITVKRDETSDPDVHLLHRFTVNSACFDSWMRVRFIGQPPGYPYRELVFYVQKGAVRTIGAQALQKLGFYQWSFFRYGAATGPGTRHMVVPPCVTLVNPGFGGYILTNGTVYRPSLCASS